jgi:hypothetical protein
VGKESGDTRKGLLDLDDPADPDVIGEPVSGPSPVPHPTLIPSFDPSRYAEESEIRERMPTLTDEAALEHARLQSFPSNAPPPRGRMSTAPPPRRAVGRDSSAEIDAEESELDALGEDEQVAILSDRLAPLTRVPTLARSMTELGALLEDPKTAYVLGFVDGILPLETIVEVTGLPELDTLRVLDRMVNQGAVVFRRGRPG